MAEQVLVPDVGEAEDVEVIEVLVKVGDTVEVDDSLVVLESDKASMEIPSPSAGVVVKVHVAEGDKVEEGGLIVELDSSASGASADDVRAETEAEPPEPDEPDQEASEDDSSEEASSDDSDSKQTEPDNQQEATESVVKVPDVGEAEDITVTEILVKVGDSVEVDDSLVVLESDKASMEIPSTVAGEVVELLVKEGDEVNEGDALAKVKGVAAAKESKKESAKPSKDDADKDLPKKEKAENKAPTADQSKAQTSTVDSSVPDDGTKVHAGPAVRKEAREYGVNLGDVKGSGRKGRILKEDVQAFVKKRLSEPASGATAGSGIPPVPVVDFSKFGEIDLQPMSRIKQASAKNLHRSWLNVPHVTQFDEADITELEAFRKAQNNELKAEGKKLTPLAFLVKACVHALQTYPQFNASLEEGYKNLILKRYYNIGVAVETPDGLVVPVIKNADQKGVLDLAAETAELAAKARDKKLPMDAMQGATFTISSLGGIGGTKFTPIVNAPEVAILGVSKSKVSPEWDGANFQPRTMLPLSLSYDHRAIDGAEAARFTNYLSKVLTDVRRLLL